MSEANTTTTTAAGKFEVGEAYEVKAKSLIDPDRAGPLVLKTVVSRRTTSDGKLCVYRFDAVEDGVIALTRHEGDQASGFNSDEATELIRFSGYHGSDFNHRLFTLGEMDLMVLFARYDCSL